MTASAEMSPRLSESVRSPECTSSTSPDGVKRLTTGTTSARPRQCELECETFRELVDNKAGEWDRRPLEGHCRVAIALMKNALNRI